MKIYVDKKEEDLIEDSLYADNTRLISEFNHEESELEYDDCELIDIGIHDRQVREEVVDEIKNRLAKQRTKMQDDTHCYPQTVVCWQDIVAILDQVKGESNAKD